MSLTPRLPRPRRGMRPAQLKRLLPDALYDHLTRVHAETAAKVMGTPASRVEFMHQMLALGLNAWTTGLTKREARERLVRLPGEL